jgi:class 3 adenylate cyclase/tetratricopeptide (TPR) repeat protein
VSAPRRRRDGSDVTESLVVCANCGKENPGESRFCNSCGAALGPTAVPTGESRKVVTVLFIDATSSTALGEQLDPESLRAVMTRYFDVMREVIEYHGGSVEKFIGDAVMAVFGVPTVHEDDALRACRAALEIHDRLAALDAEVRSERGASVEWRMGINTGEVVAGDPGTGQRIVTGDSVNVAARLEAAAEPGQILLGADTYELVRGAVVADAVKPLTLKGKAEPVSAWRLREAHEATGRHGHERPMEAPMVGRLRPMRLLEEAFREAVEERVCHLFTIMGTAGVGKSRLVEEFTGALGDQAQVAMGRCLPYGHGITYWPVTEAIRHGMGIPDDAAPEAVAERLRAALADEPEAERVIVVIGHLLGLSGAPPASEEIFWGIRRAFEAMARHRPLVLVFDDIHWGEPTFLDLVDHIADWTRDAPILLIAKARPELLERRPGWGGGKRSVTTIQLEPLSENESEELVTGLLGQADLPPELRTRIGQAAEGNPLFVEELLGKLIDDGFLVRAGDGWAALGDLRDVTIPPTISALLAARLDGLGTEDRAVIERASVEGKVFHRGAVTELAPELIRPVVRDRLASLMRMELVRPDQASFVGDEAYRFRHLLIRDAAYQALAKQTRAELHERFAAWLERVAADRVAEFEEIVAYHLEQAYRYRLELGPPDAHAEELASRAGRLLADAARRAYGRADVTATAGLLDRVRELLPRQSSERLLLLGQLGRAIHESGDGLRAEAMLREALADAEAAGEDRAAAWIDVSLIEVAASTQTIEGSDIVKVTERSRDRLAALGDVDGASRAQLAAAFALFTLGHAAEAIDRAEPIVDSAGVSPWIRLEARRVSGASSVWGPTPVEEAIAKIRRQRQELADIGAGAGAGHGIARLELLRGHFDDATRELEEAAQSFEEMGDRFLLAETEGVRGDIALARGDLREAVRVMRAGYEQMVAIGDKAYASTRAGALAHALLKAGDVEQARRFAEIAVETSATDDIASQGSGRAILARVASRGGDHDGAVALARESVEVFAQTDYLTMHADGLVHMAHVLREAGQTGKALEAASEAERLYARKGATFFEDRTRQLIKSWTE